MRFHRSILAPLMLCVAAAAGCEQRNTASEVEPGTGSPVVIDLTWTPVAAARAEKASAKDPERYSLPELRIYDARQRLIFHQNGVDPNNLDLITKTIAGDKLIAGPTFAETFGDLQTSKGRPAAELVKPANTVTVVDYWADWCVPCKALERSLLSWASMQPAGSVRLVRAETDLVKLAKLRGEKSYKIVRHPDGTISKVEM